MEVSCSAILLVDASIAFNSVNRKTFLHNVRIISPPLAKFVRNFHNLPSQLFIIGGAEIRSSEAKTISNISSHLKRLDEVITTEFIPAITDGINCLHIERKLMSLPPKMASMGIPISSNIADRKYEFSQMLSNNLTSKIINQEKGHYPNDNSVIIKSKIKLLKLHLHHTSSSKKQKMIWQDITEPKQCLNNMNQQQEASSWLIIL